VARNLVASFVSHLGRRRAPKEEGRLELKGIQQPVEIVRDRHGVPHIYACDRHDLLFAQGFVHAQDRLWQMDFQRRLASGRLAEVLGRAALDFDRWVRTLAFSRTARREVELLEPEVKADFASYSRGVNAVIEGSRRDNPLPLEFGLLGYEPEPWAIPDSLGWVKVVAWLLSVNWEAELLRTILVKRLGPEVACSLEPFDSDSPYELPEELWPAGEQVDDEGMVRLWSTVRRVLGPGVREGVGSNNWVVSGERTVTGRPILANDMHLAMTIPAVWHENHLVLDESGGRSGKEPGDGFNAVGVTFPGVPYVVSGRNESVAWGFTAALCDVQDLFVERMRAGSGGLEYEYRGDWLPVDVREETIKVRGLPARETHEILATRHGPIINSLAPEESGPQPLALRWSALDPGPLANVLPRLVRAGTCADVREALQLWTSPVVNVLYADGEGHIEFQMAGDVPQRMRGDGRLPVPGWTGEYEWAGYVPFDELPHRADPPEGYLLTANDRVVGEDYPHCLGHEFAMKDRATRIEELLQAGGRVSVEFMQAMQLDQVSPTARRIASLVGRLRPVHPVAARAAKMLRLWNGDMRPGSPEAALYSVFVERLLRRLLGTELGALTERFLDRGPTPLLGEWSVLGQKSYEWLRRELEDGESRWMRKVSGASGPGELVAAVLVEAWEELTKTQGQDPGRWEYGRLHMHWFVHFLGTVEPLAPLFNRGPYPIGGDGTTIWASPARQQDPSATRVGPPFRFVTDLGDPRESYGVLAPGESGSVSSPHYDDQAKAWLAGEYHRMPLTRDEVEAAAKARLHVEPSAGGDGGRTKRTC